MEVTNAKLSVQWLPKTVLLQRANIVPGPLYPLVCQGIAGGWYEPNGVLYPAALPITTPGGYGQLNGSAMVELYCGAPVFSHNLSDGDADQ